jgi:hypothetical protein
MRGAGPAIMNIKEMVKNKQVEFVLFREGNFFYKTECGFLFPVPLSDIGNATLHKTDNALYFMRYIRKQIELINEAAEAMKKLSDEQIKEICQRQQK